MPSPADALRRWFGLLFLALAGGLLIWGQTILRPYLDGMVFLVYWFICFLLTIAAIVIALLDIRAVRRQTREEQRRLLHQTFQSVDKAEAKKERPESKTDQSE
jgi:hypothetical protein